jgi:membrane associated rhomboid family serine protease
MRNAAVGFQCPACVTRGARDTRQEMAPYGGRRSADPSLTSKVLIGINAAVWLLIVATGGLASRWYDALALLPRGRCVPVGESGSYFPQLGEGVCSTSPSRTWVEGVVDGSWWQLATSAFAHAEIWHIGFNMLALWVLGPQLELMIGRARFLSVYLLSALAGSVMVYWLADPAGSTLGASGAVFGLMGALLVVVHKVGGSVTGILGWLGINVVITLVGRDFISWQGHLGGLLGGIAVAALVVHAPRRARKPVQYGGLAALTVLLLALVVWRTVVLAASTQPGIIPL